MFPKPQYIFLDDTGATTEEGILMIVLAAFAAVLLTILQSDPVRNGLTALVQRALDFNG
jgi:hypothetical protein